MSIKKFREEIQEKNYSFHVSDDEKEIFWVDKDSGCGDPECCGSSMWWYHSEDYSADEWKEMLTLVEEKYETIYR